MIHKQNANINKEIKTIEENQTKNLELNTIIELKETQQRCSTLHLTKQKKESANSKIFEIIQLGKQKRKKNEKEQRKSEGIMGHDNVYHDGSPRMRKKREKKKQKTYLNI